MLNHKYGQNCSLLVELVKNKTNPRKNDGHKKTMNSNLLVAIFWDIMSYNEKNSKPIRSCIPPTLTSIWVLHHQRIKFPFPSLPTRALVFVFLANCAYSACVISPLIP